MQTLTLRSLRVQEAGETSPTSDNVRSALARGLPEFSPAICFNDGHFVVVGSGPSLPSFVDEIKAERGKGRPICSIKGAHDFLIDNSLEPDLFVSCEPRDRPLKKTSARTTYLVASRCHTDLLDQLEKDKREVVLWHSASSRPDAPVPEGEGILEWDELNLTEECEVWRGRYGVGGGTTSGLRAIYIGFLMGFRKFVLYGFDSCLAKDKFTKRFSGENIGKSKLIDVIVGGKRFWCNGALAQQAVEFQKLYEGMPNISIEAKGEGLIAEILKTRRARGYKS